MASHKPRVVSDLAMPFIRFTLDGRICTWIVLPPQ